MVRQGYRREDAERTISEAEQHKGFILGIRRAVQERYLVEEDPEDPEARKVVTGETGLEYHYVLGILPLGPQEKQFLRRQRLAPFKNYRCNHVTVLNYLRKYNIPSRSKLGNRKRVQITKELLIKLYRKQGLTQHEIAKRFGHSRFGIQRWMKIYGIETRSYYESHRVYSKSDFDGSLVEKAYLIGFRLGDLNVSPRHSLIQVRCSTTKTAQTELIDRLFKKYGKVHTWRSKRGTTEITVLLNNTFFFLLNKQDLVESWILRDTEVFLAFVAGYADAEGSYYLRKPYYSQNSPQWGVFEIQTYDQQILQTMSAKLSDLRIENLCKRSRLAGAVDKRGIKNNRDAWKLVIVRKQSLWNFIKMIEPCHKHKDKLSALQRVKENLVLRNSLYHSRKIEL